MKKKNNNANEVNILSAILNSTNPYPYPPPQGFS